MRKLSLALLGLFILSFIITGCGTKVSNTVSDTSKVLTQNNADVKPFSVEDMKALGIEIGMKRDEVEKVLGKPIKEVDPNQTVIKRSLNWYYDFGSVVLLTHEDDANYKDFKDYRVTDIYIVKPNFSGPRNIKVGDSVESVLQKFPYDKNASTEKMEDKFPSPNNNEPKDNRSVKVLYGDTKGSNAGYIVYDDSGKPASIKNFFRDEKSGFYTLDMKVENEKIKSIKIGTN